MSAAPRVRTVRGDLAPCALGVTDAHDHLFLRSPALPGQELDDVAAARDELNAFAALGGGALVQWTPWGMGRRRSALASLSRESGVHLVAATGMHRAAHYDAPARSLDAGALAELFVRELTQGPVRAGLIKVAGAFHRLDAHAARTLDAAARAHHATGAPVAVHLEGGTAGEEVLGALVDTHGVPPYRVLLGHAQRFPDRAVHRRLAARGAYLVLDGPSRAHHATDWGLFESLAALCEAGHAERLLVGGDTVTAAARSTADGPGAPYLLSGLRPRLARELGEETAKAVFEANPARALGVRWLA
ncbi:phosphotriesterase [Streptomyces sp. NPDC047046]|uniref:phosphotriesterase family protein n=1 Tax=Streptomyces sp. NPDC047046 TaxID=3155378 RepID=UPI0033DA3B03